MTSVMELVRMAREQVENLTPEEVAAELADGTAVLVDTREASELSSGMIPGAIHAPRGMLEFHADPGTKDHLGELQPERRVIIYRAARSRAVPTAGRRAREAGWHP